MKIAALQMVSTPSVDDNLATAQRLIARATRDGAQLVVLPEYFCVMGQNDRAKLEVAEGDGNGPIQRMLGAAAREHGIWLIGGTLPIRCADADRVLNANCVHAPDGTLAARYDKIHLFRYDNGREKYDEARVIEPGSEPVAFTLTARDGQAWRIGLSVCYDLRFPELYRRLAADVLLVPSAFTHTTGQAHWETLLRARAIENLAYVVAPAQGGLHENGRRTWGHSMVIDPWGEVLAQQDEGAGVVIATLDR